MKWLAMTCPVLLSACVHQPTAECTRLLTTMRTQFEHYDANKDGRISRQEFQPVIDAMSKLAEKEKMLRGALYDPRQFEEQFTNGDQNRDGYLSFEEFTGGLCKKGYIDRSWPALPKD